MPAAGAHTWLTVIETCGVDEQVLTSSPWVQSRTVHVMAVQQAGAEQATTYTLRTRLQRNDMSEALSKVCPFTRGGMYMILANFDFDVIIEITCTQC